MKQIITTKQALRYNRQISLAGFDIDKQERLLASRVLLIGLGGLGCAAAQYLVAAGVGHITLVDDDEVDYSNLQRQVLHGEQNVGQAKCDSAQQSLFALNSECKLVCIKHRLADDELLQVLNNIDIIVDCSDNLSTRNQLNAASVAKQLPLVSGAAIRMEGQICCFMPNPENPCYQCFSELFGEQQLSCVEAGVMSPLVGIIGAMQGLETIKLLAEYGTPLINKLMLFDAMSTEWQSFTIPKSKNCKVCS